MKFLTPLGLLGLLGLLVLLIIYLLKPNYQQKLVSSTFVWKLSLKYKRKRLPTSKLRDILLILCQVLVLTLSAAALATPVQVLREQPVDNEVIAIVDASASMRSVYNDTMRFERAVNQASTMAETVFARGGKVSLIKADSNPVYLAKQATQEDRSQYDDAIADLMYDEFACTYGSADIEAAMRLCEEVAAENPLTKIYLYTDTEYTYVPQNVSVVNVGVQGKEINSAILGATATFTEGYYQVAVKVAVYGVDTTVHLRMNVWGANAANINESGENKEIEIDVDCASDEVKTVIFTVKRNESDLSEEEKANTVYYMLEETERFYSYQTIFLTLDDNGETDSIMEDNTFCIYGGQKEVLRIKYSSSLKNRFMTAALLSLQKNYANQWDIRLVENPENDDNVGYDFYIFEHEMPAAMPKDGVVLLIDPDSVPSGSGITVRNILNFNGQLDSLSEDILEGGQRHPILKDIVASNILISRYVVMDDDGSYTTLMNYSGDPILMVRDEPDSKVAVMAFSLHYSNLPLLIEFPRLMNNLFNYFMPTTVNANYFEVGSSIDFNSRGSYVTVKSESGVDFEQTIDTFPSKMVFSTPGTYRIKQTGFLDKEAPDIQIYVKTPAVESNTVAVEPALYDPFTIKKEYDYFNDLLIYLAAAIVALLFLEWILQLRDNM